MKIGELFVGLGVKGSEQSIKAVGNVKSGLGEVKSMSLEAKAAIVGVVYALEKMMSQSAQMGTALTNFNALTGMSAKELQQWQYAARQVGVSGDEMTSSLKSVQGAMAQMLMGQGAPAGMAMLANKVGFDPARARDTLYVMQQLQKLAQAVPQDVGNQMLKSFGLSEGTIAAMRRNAFRPEVFAKAPVYGDKETGQLDRVNVAWSNLGQKIQMAFGHFTAKHGMQLVSDLTKITDGVVKLAEALQKVAEQYKIFGAIAKLANFTAEALESKPGTLLGEKHLEKKVWDWFTMKGKKQANPYAAIEGIKPIWDSNNFAAPAMKQTGAPTEKQDIEVNQTMIFQHDGKDAKKTGESVNKAVKDAYRQMQAQGQGS